VAKYGYTNKYRDCWKLGACIESAVGSGGISNQPVVPGAPKSLPGVREQLLSHRVGDTCKTSFYIRAGTRCILFKDDECEIDLSLYWGAFRQPFSPSFFLPIVMNTVAMRCNANCLWVIFFKVVLPIQSLSKVKEVSLDQSSLAAFRMI